MSTIKSVISLRWVDRLIEATGYLCGVGLILATLTVLHGVLVRYFLNKPTLWQTELATYLLIAVTFIGAGYGLKHHAHVGVDILLERLPVTPQVIVRTCTALLALGVIALVGWTSVQMWHEAYEGGYRSGTSWNAPLSVVYAILPLGMFLLALQYLRLIIDAISCLVRRTPDNALLLGPQTGASFAGEPDASLSERAG